MSTIDDLRKQIESAAEEAGTDDPQIVTLADVAAAAFVSLEALAQILKPDDATKLLDAYDARRAAYTMAEQVEEAEEGEE